MRKIVSIVLVLIMVLSVMPLAYAEEPTAPVQALEEVGEDGSIMPRVEEIGWIYRYNKELDRNEKRLWSYTYGVWLTDWIPCD